ncbi:MAG: RNB domain-containing ribonuclease [Candidatus Solibacter usitatus]|nr:RNB domain-containing ribonuclease [Candidatus Solibacter usitatus]
MEKRAGLKPAPTPSGVGDVTGTPEVDKQVAALAAQPAAPADPALRDLRKLLWSSIDNDTSRDLDQIEVAERTTGGVRVLIGIADVDGDVKISTPIDRHAASETTSVYTGVRTFSMLPEKLSTDLTSLVENGDRLAVVVEIIVAGDGSISAPAIYRALVHNRAQLAYNGVGPWLEGTGAPPPKVAASAELQAQLKLQDEAAQALRQARHQCGALDFGRIEPEAVIQDGRVQGIAAHQQNRAGQLIEDFMIAANEVMARTLPSAGVSSIRRVVKSPERWPRIVELARQCGETLPPEPDAAALNAFLQKRKVEDAVHFPDLSLSIIKLMGPGEYIALRPGDAGPGHFGLAVHDYTHSTAPNRRFADLVTQRLIKAVMSRQPPPYTDGALDSIAQNCTAKEDAARKVERVMHKRIAAVALHGQIGKSFSGVVTGVTSKGVFVRIMNPPAEGRLMRGEQGVDVGDSIRVTLLNTDPQRGFIDFGR